ncbi:MAG: amidohydrolase [Chloroflexi bacterium]|nr:amidohydrolase [Chloroflexota bacterium]
MADTRSEYVSAVVGAVDALHDELVEISLDIHSHPQVNYEEQHAAKLLADNLESHGFHVERGVGGVETAFRGTLNGGGGDGPTVGLLAEYDALPEIGHGCGHNLIAISNLGAGLAAQSALGSLPGRIVVLGTPAEEGGGGKIRMLDAGVFDGVDIALSSHPSSNMTSFDTDAPPGTTWSLAMASRIFEFHGKAAHAAARPEAGINALNAVIHLFTGIDAMRQHLRDDTRIHGVVTHGGTAANVVPEYAAADFMMRSRDRVYLTEVLGKVMNIAEGAATMTGARLEPPTANPMYEDVRPNTTLAGTAEAIARDIGMDVDPPASGSRGSGASTDFGNVSHVMPSFAMRFAVSREPVPGHSRLMTEAARTDLAHENALATAKVLGIMACDLLADPGLAEAARREFAARGA